MQKNLEFSQKALTFVIPKPNGAVVQLVRMPACHAGGREFESRPHRREAQSKDWAFFLLLMVEAERKMGVGQC